MPERGSGPKGLFRRDWVATTIIVALLAAIIVLLWPGGKAKVTFPFEKGSSWWTQFPWQAAVGVLAAVGALVTFVVNKRQKDLHFHLQTLEDRFRDILDRFADKNSPLMRANAAIRLEEMAEEGPLGRPSGPTCRSFPFFSRAVAQLAAALHMEEDDRVRAEVLKALRRAAEFGAGRDQTLLRLETAELADANRQATRAFLQALGAYWASRGGLAQEPTEEELRALLPVARFCSTPDVRRPVACLRDLLLSEACGDAEAAALLLGEVAPADRERASAPLLARVRAGATVLADARTALAECVSRFAAPALARPRRGMRGAAAFQRPDLSSCFLADAALQGANLASVDLSGAWLHNAWLRGADLRYARLRWAHLSWAHLDGANLEGAQLTQARMAGVHLEGARLVDADLSAAGLRHAILSGADVSRGELALADLAGARLCHSCLQDTRLRWAELGHHPRGTAPPADFTGANWWEADFAEDGNYDVELITWLEEHFPRQAPAGPDRGP